jgi:hypothetical protein
MAAALTAAPVRNGRVLLTEANPRALQTGGEFRLKLRRWNGWGPADALQIYHSAGSQLWRISYFAIFLCGIAGLVSEQFSGPSESSQIRRASGSRLLENAALG